MKTTNSIKLVACLTLCAEMLYPVRAEEAPTAASPTRPSITTTAANYLPEISANGITRWPPSRMPIKVFIKPGTDVPGYRSQYESTLKQAIADWAQGSNDAVKFTYVASEPQADIVCSWTNDQSRLSSKDEDGHAVLIPDADGILRAEILLLTQSPAGKGMTDKYTRRVYLHEIGHALGLSGHSSQPTDIMYRTVDPGDGDSILSARDRNTLSSLYSLDMKLQAKLTTTPTTSLPANTSPQMQAMKLSNEAVTAMNSKHPEEAVKKLEEAHKLDPNNGLICANLGGIYANYAAMATMMRNFQAADVFFTKAIPLLEQSPNKTAAASVIQSYCSVLRSTNRAVDANKLEEHLKVLKTGK